MKFERVDDKQQSGTRREADNFRKVARVFADYDINCIKLIDEAPDVNFLAGEKDQE